MANIIKPHKLIINIDEKGNFTDAILIYQIKDTITGEVFTKFNTVSVKTTLSIPIISTILKNAIDSTTIKEN